MIERKVNSLLAEQIAKKLVNAEDAEIYKYGYTLVIELGIHILITTILGIITGWLSQTIKKPVTSFTGIALILLLVMLFPINAFAAELPQVNKMKNTAISDKASETSVLRTIITLDKEVKIFYHNADSIPTSISHSEYTYGGWFSGILYLREVKEVKLGLEATFSGKITGSI